MFERWTSVADTPLAQRLGVKGYYVLVLPSQVLARRDILRQVNRIPTYNVSGINGRLANLLGRLEEAMPDIVCLQELKAPDDKFPAAAIRAAGYGAVWHGQKSWNGVAILARAA
jgi:endonuclease/exonuclease/phosphatase (EEP) superfamily protein YafD